MDVKLRRTPAVYERKLKRRKYPEQYEELGEEDFRLNYPSARQAEETIEAQFAREVEPGAMKEVSLQEAKELYGDRLAIASLGAIRKSDNSVRVVHDATHGQNINNVIKVRDAQHIPTGTDLTCALATLPYAFFSMSGDIARAHRLIRVRSSDWGFQACRARDPSRVFLNCVGTFGVASAAYWWHRLMAMIGRLVYFMHGRDETILMTYVDDLVWLTQSHQGLRRILGSLFFMILLGVPFAWKKFSGGQEHGWIGLSLDVSARMVGISKAGQNGSSAGSARPAVMA